MYIVLLLSASVFWLTLEIIHRVFEITLQ